MPDQSPAPASGSDITILVPAYQCAGQLLAHSQSLQKYRALGCPIIWVVSPSPDRSDTVAEEICIQTGDSFLLSPPGLYASWNFGVAHVKTPFLSFSTINDSYINTGLIQMAGLLQNNQADLCFSPPVMRGISQRDIDWPVLVYPGLFKKRANSIISHEFLLIMQILSGLSCVLGSWASILARSSFLKSRPFPTDFGHYGDTAWFYRSLLDSRICYIDEPISIFTVQDLCDSRKTDGLKMQNDRKCLADELMTKAYKAGLNPDKFFRYQKSFLCAGFMLNNLRGFHPRRFWWINPRAWILRFQRSTSSLALKRLLASLP